MRPPTHWLGWLGLTSQVTLSGWPRYGGLPPTGWAVSDRCAHVGRNTGCATPLSGFLPVGLTRCIAYRGNAVDALVKLLLVTLRRC